MESTGLQKPELEAPCGSEGPPARRELRVHRQGFTVTQSTVKSRKSKAWGEHLCLSAQRDSSVGPTRSDLPQNDDRFMPRPPHNLRRTRRAPQPTRGPVRVPQALPGHTKRASRFMLPQVNSSDCAVCAFSCLEKRGVRKDRPPQGARRAVLGPTLWSTLLGRARRTRREMEKARRMR